MSTPTGAETIRQRLTRLRAELARVRQTIERTEKTGQSFSIRGTSVTQIAYERALDRAVKLEAEIRTLESRLAGGQNRPGLANLGSRSW